MSQWPKTRFGSLLAPQPLSRSQRSSTGVKIHNPARRVAAPHLRVSSWGRKTLAPTILVGRYTHSHFNFLPHSLSFTRATRFHCPTALGATTLANLFSTRVFFSQSKVSFLGKVPTCVNCFASLQTRIFFFLRILNRRRYSCYEAAQEMVNKGRSFCFSATRNLISLF